MASLNQTKPNILQDKQHAAKMGWSKPRRGRLYPYSSFRQCRPRQVHPLLKRRG